MRKHPILLGLAILGSIFFAFIIVVLVIASFSRKGNLLSIGEKIGVVEVTGLIADSGDIVKQLVDYGDNPGVRAVVLRIDSPGGIVGATQEIYSEVRRVSRKKPVVASCGSIAASGGYYVAVATDRIVANPGTITGSIGVIMKFANAQELFGKIGVKTNVLKSGEFKDIGSTAREMTAKEKAMVQTVIDDVHTQFVQVVCDGRKLSKERVAELADGRIFSGRQAVSLGLMDKLGNMEEAIDQARQMARIEGEPVVVYPKKGISLWDVVLGGRAGRLMGGLSYSPYSLYFETKPLI